MAPLGVADLEAGVAAGLDDPEGLLARRGDLDLSFLDLEELLFEAG